jgi:hypothetical protein
MLYVRSFLFGVAKLLGVRPSRKVEVITVLPRSWR